MRTESNPLLGCVGLSRMARSGAGDSKREIAWLLVVKFVALAVLKVLFFSPAHRHPVDGDSASRQFGIAQQGERS